MEKVGWARIPSNMYYINTANATWQSKVRVQLTYLFDFNIVPWHVYITLPDTCNMANEVFEELAMSFLGDISVALCNPTSISVSQLEQRPQYQQFEFAAKTLTAILSSNVIPALFNKKGE